MALKKTEEAQRLPKIYGLSCETIRRHRRHEDGTPYTSNKIILYDDAGIVATLYKSSRRDSERADVAAVLPASAYEDEETKRNVCDISKKLLGAEPQNLFYLKR
jgi:hypothetical protein